MKQKSHKLLSLLLTFALMLSLAPTALAACNHNQWSEWKTDFDATCSKEGQISRVCSVCGEVEKKVISKKPHSWGAETTVTAATCTTQGTIKHTCTVCNTTETETKPALGHNYTEVNSATNAEGYEFKKVVATCGTEGRKVEWCSRCKDIRTTTVPKTNKHTPPSRTSITQTADNHTYICTECKKSVTEAHDYKTTGASVCSVCGRANPNAKEIVSLNVYSHEFTAIYQTLQLRANVSPTNRAVTWSSSDSNVASVDYSGKVTAKAQGSAVITATTSAAPYVQASCSVRVLNNTSSVLTASPSSVSVNTGDWTTVSVSTSRTDGSYVDWSVPRNSYARISDSRSITPGYAVDSRISNSRATIYVYGDASGSTTLTATLRDSRGNRIGDSISIPVYVGSSASRYLTPSRSSITTNSNGWSSAVYVSTNTSGYDGYIVDWSTSGSGIRVSTSTNTSNPYTSVSTSMDGRYSSPNVYVYATSSSSYGSLTATLRRTANGTAIDSVTIPVNTNYNGFTLSKSPNSSSVNLGYYDDYYWDYDRYDYRDFSVTPYLSGSSIYNDRNYDIYYTWKLNGYTVQSSSSSSNSRSYTLRANNPNLYSSSRSNTLTCSVEVYYRNASTTTSNSLYSSSASWTVYTDRYYDDDYTVSATVYDTSSGYQFDERDDRGNSSIISQMESKLPSNESIDYVRFSDVTDTYGDLDASTSRDYYYSGSRGSYDLRDVTFTPDRVGRTGTATFQCTVYGTRNTHYSCTIRITVSDGGSSSSGDIKYSARAGASVDFSASDFRSWWRDSYSRGDLDYVRFSSPSNGSLYIDYDRSNSSTVGSTYCYYSPSSRQTGISDLTFVPSSSSTKSATVRFTAYGTTSSSSSSTTSMSGTVSISYTGTTGNAATINYSTTGTKSVNLSASDFTGRYRDVMDTSAPSNMTIRFRSAPSSGTLAIGNTTLTSSNMSSYNFSSSSSGSNRISDVKYTPRSNTSYTETVNYDCYTGSTLRFSGTITFKNTADNTNQVAANVAVSYSSTGGNVSFNATDFIVGKGSAMAGSNYLVFGSPSSGSLYVGSTPLTSGTQVSYVAATGKQLLGSVSYHPAAGFNGTATIPFTAYNSNGTTAATGTVSIRVTQQTNNNTNNNRTSFNDVPGTAWYYNDVTTLAQANIVNGRNDGLFHPNDPVNYGEALKLILLAAGYPQQTEGSGNAWAQNYLNLAIAQGILPGSAANYTLSAAMNRTTIATVAAKALKLTPVTNEASPYADAVDAEGYVLALTKAGIVQGDASSGRQMWNGSDNLTRAQISRIVYNVYKYRNVTPGGTASVDTDKPSWLN